MPRVVLLALAVLGLAVAAPAPALAADQRVTTQKLKAKAGTVRRTLAAAHGRRFAKGRYRVVVSSPDSGYDLVSSALSLR